MSTFQSLTSMGTAPTACTASVWNKTPASWATLPISRMGSMVPISLLAAMMVMSTVSGRMAFFTSSTRTSPFSSTGR